MDPSASVTTISRRTWLILATVCTLILLPSAFFPMGHDQAIYFVGGEMIASDGAVPYRDFIDTKPPAIFYLNALAIRLFGDAGGSIRMLDLLIQSLTALLLIRLVHRIGGDRLWAVLCGLLYAIVYVAFSPVGTAHTESYTGITTVGILLLVVHRRTSAAFVLAGVLAGVAFLFKFSFAMELVVAAAVELGIRQPWRQRFHHWMLLGIGFAAVVMVFVLYLSLFHLWDGFRLQRELLQGYVGIGFHSKSLWLKTVIKETARHMGDNYSITLLGLTIVGAGLSFERHDPPGNGNGRTQFLLQLLGLGFLMMLVTVWMEAHYTYQYNRIYIFGIPLAAYAITRLIRRLRQWPVKGVVPRAFLYAGSLLALMFSPVMRYVYHSAAGFVGAVRGERALDAYYSQMSPLYTHTELDELRDYVRARSTVRSDLFVAGVVGGLVYYSIGTLPSFPLYQSVFFTARYAPDEWKRSTASYLLRRRPRFIIAQTNDGDPLLMGEEVASDRGLQQLPGIRGLLQEQYHKGLATADFVVFERNDATRQP